MDKYCHAPPLKQEEYGQREEAYRCALPPDDGQVLTCSSYEAGGVRSGSFSEAGEVLLCSSLVWKAPHGGKIHVGKTEVVTNELESCIFILFAEYIICYMMLPEAVYLGKG